MSTQDTYREIARRYPKTPKDIPDVEHWAIMIGSSYTDTSYGERSSHPYLEYRAYLDKDEWLAEIKTMMTSTFKKEFKALHIKPIKFDMEVKILEV